MEGDSLTVSQVANANNGSVELAGGEARATPTPGFGGTARFESQASDVHGAPAIGSVAVRVRDDLPKPVVVGPLPTCAVFHAGPRLGPAAGRGARVTRDSSDGSCGSFHVTVALEAIAPGSGGRWPACNACAAPAPR
ncbi:Ig-like domain-containing protein [Myxococcus stipitatus]|uniref:Ig-like domain-containing protein n=1 Tax=Myxococcus stipitatus TaxID=83455 RepID=UPI003AF24A64